MPGVKLRPPALPRQRSQAAVVAVAAGAAALLVLWALNLVVALPTYVNRVTITNPTPYEINVLVRGPADDGWYDLGAIAPNSTEAVDEVVDQGSRWTFHFSYAGVFAGEMELSRSDLKHAGWQVTIPPGSADPIEAAGIPPSSR